MSFRGFIPFFCKQGFWKFPKEYSAFVLENEFWIYNNKHEVVNSMRIDYTKVYDFRLNNDGSIMLSGIKQGKQTIEKVSLSGKISANKDLVFPYPTYTIRMDK